MNILSGSSRGDFYKLEIEGSGKERNIKVKDAEGHECKIRNKVDLNRFISEESIKIENSQLPKAEKIQRTHSLQKLTVIFSNSQKEVSSDQITMKTPSIPVETIQVLHGKDQFYIGTLIPHDIIQEAALHIPKDFNNILTTETHITIMPPSDKIGPSTKISDSLNLDRPIEVKFDKITISTRRNVNIWGNEEAFRSASKTLSKSLNIKENDRPPHAKIGMLSHEDTAKIFADPEKYGFKRDVGRDTIYKKLDKPISLHISSAPSGEYPEEQLLLINEFSDIEAPSEEELREANEKFLARKRIVDEQQQQLREKKYHGDSTVSKFVKTAPFNDVKLDLAVHGTPELGRIPLTFSCRENGIKLWKEFLKDVNNLFAEFPEYDDVKIQILGSGVHGFSRNPHKDPKNWSMGSDCDCAIFSKKMAIDAAKIGVQTNKKIQLMGKFTCYKNEKDPTREGIGFHDTKIGHAIHELENKWSVKLYGENRPVGTDLDFKLNIRSTPFLDSIYILNK